ncbi:hypothetical protein Hdeb2414_s0003g00105901 [Helianthus debilis subsp. tardiflorus]
MPIGFWVESIGCRKPEQEQQCGCLVWVLMVYQTRICKLQTVRCASPCAGFRGWSASQRRLPEKNIRYIDII